MSIFEIKEPIYYIKSSETMEEISDNSIQLIVTSPPYAWIRNYGNIKEQIGYFDSLEDYFNRLKKVWGECYRVLESQCRLIINVGDQYLRASEYGRYSILSIASKIIEDCLRWGFDFLGDLIWKKISTTNTSGGCSWMGTLFYPRGGLITYDYEHILIFKKYQGKAQPIDQVRKELSKISLSEWKKWFIGHWEIKGVQQIEHIAMFPEELPYRLIRMFSLIGDKVLDPFLGSGTSTKCARALFRQGIGYEINPEYKRIIEKKSSQGIIGYFKDFQFILYTLWKKAQKENFSVDLDAQKQKGIVILVGNHKKIIIDYILFDTSDPTKIIREIESKLEENMVKRYLEDKLKEIKNYVFVLNFKEINLDKKIMIEHIWNYITQKKLSKGLSIIDINDFVAEDFQIWANF